MDRSLLKTVKPYVPYIFFVAITIAVSYVAIDLVIKERLEDLRSQIQLQISEQETLLATIAETAARNGADEVTERIVRDCSIDERTDFDNLLGQLDRGLSFSDLTKLERLFGRCGSFYSERKAMMVARLSREVEVYEKSVSQLETISSTNMTAEYPVEKWKLLIEEEMRMSELFNLLVQHQDEIIKTLLAGKSAESPEIKSILTEVRETQESLMVANTQAASLRAELVPL